MLYYDNATKFMPSKDTLYKWLKTRKSELGVKPGLFETIDSSTDQLWAFIALLIEFTALGLTLYGAWVKYVADPKKLSLMILAGILVLLFIVFDYIGILLHIHDETERVIVKNKIRITKDLTALNTLHLSLQKVSLRRFASYLLLLLSALLKIFALLAFVGKSPLLILILTLFYLVVIYIHSQHTGYFLSHLQFNSAVKKEQLEWLDATSKGLPSPFSVSQSGQTIFSVNRPLFPIENQVWQNNGQKITFRQKTNSEDGSVNFEYVLSCEGCLWDEDILRLIGHFNPHHHAAIIENCIKLQLNQLGLTF